MKVGEELRVAADVLSAVERKEAVCGGGQRPPGTLPSPPPPLLSPSPSPPPPPPPPPYLPASSRPQRSPGTLSPPP